MTKSPTETPDEELDLAVGTHPASILGVAAGVFSVFFGGGCSLLDPRMGTLNHGLLGVIALGCGLFVWRKVSRKELDPCNLFQVRWALGLGGASLLIAIAWAVWIVQHPMGY